MKSIIMPVLNLFSFNLLAGRAFFPLFHLRTQNGFNSGFVVFKIPQWIVTTTLVLNSVTYSINKISIQQVIDPLGRSLV